MTYANLIAHWPLGAKVAFWIAYWSVALLFIWKIGVPFSRWFVKSWKRLLGVWVFLTVWALAEIVWRSQPLVISLLEFIWFGAMGSLTFVLEVLSRRAARAALDRYYQVPYEHELTSFEREGMKKLEKDGVVERDEGFLGATPHWHRRDT